MHKWTTKLVREPATVENNICTSPRAVARFAKNLLADEPQEVVLAISLDINNNAIGWTEATRGLLDASFVHAREVFRAAILANAASIIVVHNHPSGKCMPSNEDKEVCKSLAEAGKILGIGLLDFVIITWNDIYSFKEWGEHCLTS